MDRERTQEFFSLVEAMRQSSPSGKLPCEGFRSISATMIEKHEAYGRYKTHFLGQSPKTIADKHYAAPSSELFDRIMDWLRVELLGNDEVES